FAKQFMEKYRIPTAAYKTFTKENVYEGFKFIDSLKAPYVLKADGPAAGKGVLIIDDADDAKRELAAMVSENKFGDSGN
ncbi:phosphoribosylamine--glycine ligase, partial [Klebsiella quasipneumoniae]|nr:phosphoribosylamine--glycine ligase [Klebsiella quasipneumoniae]